MLGSEKQNNSSLLQASERIDFSSFPFSLALFYFVHLIEGHEPRKRNHDHRQSQIIIIIKEEKSMLELSEIKRFTDARSSAVSMCLFCV